jgi:hypothetical protein
MYDKIMNGEMSAIDAYIELYEAKKAIEQQIDEIKPLAILEREKYGKEDIMRRGFKVEIASGRAMWDYKGVSLWKSLKSRMADVEKMAQTVAMKAVEIVDTETGEVIEPAKVTYTADTLRLTYKGE